MASLCWAYTLKTLLPLHCCIDLPQCLTGNTLDPCYDRKFLFPFTKCMLRLFFFCFFSGCHKQTDVFTFFNLTGVVASHLKRWQIFSFKELFCHRLPQHRCCLECSLSLKKTKEGFKNQILGKCHIRWHTFLKTYSNANASTKFSINSGLKPVPSNRHRLHNNN